MGHDNLGAVDGDRLTATVCTASGTQVRTHDTGSGTIRASASAPEAHDPSCPEGDTSDDGDAAVIAAITDEHGRSPESGQANTEIDGDDGGDTATGATDGTDLPGADHGAQVAVERGRSAGFTAQGFAPAWQVRLWRLPVSRLLGTYETGVHGTLEAVIDRPATGRIR